MVITLGLVLNSAAWRARYRQTLLLSGSLVVLSVFASPALADCASGDGQLTGPGAVCNNPQTLTGADTPGTVATGWTLSTGSSDAYSVSGPGDVLTNAGNITSSAADQTVNISGAGAGLSNQGQISNTGSGSAIVVTNASGGSIDNALGGNISATGANGYGIEATGSIAGNITNEGVIGVTGVNTNFGGQTNGINVLGDVSGVVTNSGFITSTAGDAITVAGNVAGINNSGNLSAGVIGIDAGLTVTNLGGGTLIVLAGPPFNDTQVGAVTGDLINSGNITAGVGGGAQLMDGKMRQ
jgi:hypothetical protein